MALFDSIIGEAKEKFGLSGDSAGGLVAALLGLIADPAKGGFGGFIDKFKNAGLGDTVNSWITTGDNTPLSNEQVESALGEETIGDFADQAGVDRSTATSALAGMIPGVVDTLTPDGEVPDEASLLTRIGGFLSDWGGAIGGAVAGGVGVAAAMAGGAADKVGDAAGATYDKGKEVLSGGVAAAGAVGDKVSGAIGGVSNALDSDSGGGSILKWLLPLLLLLLLIALGWMFCGRGSAPTAPANANANKANVNANANANKSVSVNANANAAELNKAAEDALSRASTAEEITKALNISIINFATGKSDIPADAVPLIKAASDAMKKLPDGTVIEIGGHTDNQGNAAANLKLSQSRADSVRSELIKDGVKEAMLKAKGYGDAKPVADNNTDEGRKKNRRIEYAALSGSTTATTTSNTATSNSSPANTAANSNVAPK